jgi:SAM-dependent methyltransferase
MTSAWDQLLADNQAAWDAKVAVHAASRFYDVEGFRKGASSLQSIELDLLGDVRGQRLLHLQCHFGLDTLSLARLGAEVVGVDFSEQAVLQARALAADLGLAARFVCCNVYDTRAHVSETFDLVFASYGVLGWLPDLGPWAQVVAASLRPGGRFVLVEFHPVIWMSQMGPDLLPRYSYFNTGPISEVETGTYAARDADLTLEEHSWNHSVAEIVNALVDAGLTLERMGEHDHSPYDIFPGLTPGADGRLRFASAPGMVPIVLSLVVSRPV